MTRNNLSNLINMICFNVIWFFCIFSAAWDYTWWGLLLSLPCLMLQLRCFFESAVNHAAGLKFALLLMSIGLTIDSLMFRADVFLFSAPIGTLKIAPPFLWALWFSFGLSFWISLYKKVVQNFWLGAVLACVGFPIAYAGGAKLGAGVATYGTYSYLWISMFWCVMFPLLVRSFDAMMVQPHFNKNIQQ